jgi:hypothetical protein
VTTRALGRTFQTKRNTSMAMQTFEDDDDLSSIPTSSNPTSNKPSPLAAAAKVPTSGKTNGKPTSQLAVSNKPAPDPDDVDFGDEEYLKAEDYLPVLKVERGKVVRFAMCPGFKLKTRKTHYFEGTGSVGCRSTEGHPAICCSTGNQAKSKFVGLVFHYTNCNDQGKFPTPETKPTVEVKAVRLSRSNYRDLNECLEEDQSPHSVDFKFQHDTSRAFGYKFGRMASVPRWKMIEKEALALLEPFKDGTKLASRLCKMMSEAELKTVVTGMSPEIGGKLKPSDFEDDVRAIGEMGE